MPNTLKEKDKLVGTPIFLETFKRKDGDKLFAIIKLPGKRGMYFPYNTPELSRQKAEEYLGDLMVQDINRAASRAKHKAEKDRANAEAPALVNIGDIYYSSWGYDQTNIDYYQVIEKRGHIAVIREICQDRERTYSDGGTCSPIKDSFVKDALPLKKRIQGSKYSGKTEPYFTLTSFSHASKWDGNLKSWSDGH